MSSFLKKFQNNFLNNIHLFFGCLFIIILFVIFDNILDLTIWGVIKKIVIYENTLTARSLLLSNIFPLITFSQNLGFPLLAESQAGIFEPLNLIINLIFGPLKLINYSIICHLLLWLCGIYFLLNSIYKVEKSIAIFTSLIATLSPLVITDLIHQFSLQSLSYLPICLILVEKFLINENKKFIFFQLLSLTIFFMLLAGNFTYQIIAISFLFSYTTVALYLTSISYKNFFLKFLVFCSSLIFGFTLASFQLLPTLELMQLGPRSDFSDSVYLGSLGYSGISVFYKSISKEFHNIGGTIGTLGYLTIFVFFFHRLFNFSKIRNENYNRFFIQIIITSIFLYIISLGQHFPLNDILYKFIPFLDSMRFPQRWMHINGLSTLLLSAIALHEINKIDFKISRLKLTFIAIFIIYIFVFLWHFPSMKNRSSTDLYYWRHFIYIFYPLIMIISSFVLINFFRAYLLRFFVILIFLISLIEIIFLNFIWPQYTLTLKKSEIYESEINSINYCKEFDTNSLNIVGEFKDDDLIYFRDTYKNNWYSPITTNECNVFYHHAREDVTKNGLGYTSSSLGTFLMRSLSEYQHNYLNNKFNNFNDNKEKYISSLNRYFTKSKSFYVINNEISDDYIDFSKEEINSFINNFEYLEKDTFFKELQTKFGLKIFNLLVDSDLIKLFPSLKLSQTLKIKMDNFYFLSIWQSNSYYYIDGKNSNILQKHSFGHKVTNLSNNLKIYYVPLSFVAGLIVTLLSIFIMILSIALNLLFLKKK